MNALAWNCRGLGQARTVQELVRLVRNFCPKVVFLSETRQSNERVSKLRWRLGLKNFLTMKGDGSGGDIALLWDEGLYVDTLSMGHRHFDGDYKSCRWFSMEVYLHVWGTSYAGSASYVGATAPYQTGLRSPLADDGRFQ